MPRRGAMFAWAAFVVVVLAAWAGWQVANQLPESIDEAPERAR